MNPVCACPSRLQRRLPGYDLVCDRMGNGSLPSSCPARTMAGIDSSELVDDEAPNYFAAGESVAPTATKTVATGRPSIDANTLHERIGRNRRDILREV